MKVLIPEDINFYSSNLPVDSTQVYSAALTYALGAVVKVTSSIPWLKYQSQRSGNIGHNPPDYIEPQKIESVTDNARASTTSTTSIVMGTGLKSITLAASGLGYFPTGIVKIMYTSSPTFNYMIGEVQSLSGTTLVVDIKEVVGEGTFAAWTIRFLGLSISSGDKKTYIGTGLALEAGMMIKLSHPTTPASRYIEGEIEAYNSTTGFLEFVAVGSSGSGNFLDWKFEVDEEEGWWKEIGAVPSHLMLDSYNNTSTSNHLDINMVLDVSSNYSAALFGLIGDWVHVEWWDKTEYVRDDFSDSERAIYSPAARQSGNFGAACAYSTCGKFFAVTECNVNNSSGNKVLIYTVDDFETETLWATISLDDAGIVSVGGDTVTVDDSIVYLPGMVTTETSSFGTAVAMSDNAEYVFVGDTEQVGTSPGSGAVYVFSRLGDGNNYVLHQKLNPPESMPGSRFGAALALTGNNLRLYVGQPRYTGTETNQGRALHYYFPPVGTRRLFTVPSSILLDTVVQAGRLAGSALATDYHGYAILVGCPGDASNEYQAGCVRIFRPIANAAEKYGYDIDEANYGDRSIYSQATGSAVAMSSDGRVVAIGSSQDNETGSLFRNGAFRLYLRASGGTGVVNLTEIEEVYGSVLFQTYYGSAIAMTPDGLDIMVGAKMDSSGISYQGSVWNYSRPRPYHSESIAINSPANIVVFPEELEQVEDVYLRINLTASSGDVSISNLLVGEAFEIGDTSYGVVAGITDYSVKETDEEGRTTIKVGYYNKTQEAMVYCENTRLDTIFNTLVDMRGVRTAWIGNSNYTSYSTLVVYGIYSNFSVTVEGYSHSWCSLSIMGLT